jgi:Flp pilus assembly CpaF family ATPase
MSQPKPGQLIYSPWPEIHRDVADTVEVLFRHIDNNRKKNNLPASIRDEDTLWDDIDGLINEVVAHPVPYGIEATERDHLRDDEKYRTNVMIGLRVRASRFYPLSRLLYLVNGLEDIHCMGWNDWTITAQNRVIALTEEGSPFRNDADVELFFREDILTLYGISGNTQLNPANPVAEVTLGGGRRLEVAIEPAVSGKSKIYAALRVPGAIGIRSLDDYVARGIMQQGIATFLAACMAARANIVIAGGTASGKTTLMRVLASYIPENEIVVVIEDSAELRLDEDRGDGEVDPKTGLVFVNPWVRLVIPLVAVPDALDYKGITLRDHTKTSLRFRPRRILLGETRGAEAADVMVAMSTGHDGGMLTVHADNAEDAIEQLVTYVAEAPRYNGNFEQAKISVHRAIDIVVHLEQAEGGIRRVSGIVGVGRAPGHQVVIYGEDGFNNVFKRLVPDVTALPDRLQRRLKKQFPSGELPPL